MEKIKIKYVELSDLIPYVNNTKIHSETQVNAVASSIKEFGFNNPILTDGVNGVIAGHCRILSAQKLKMEQVPTIELSHLSEAQKKAYVIADNRLAELAIWDEEMLQMELDSLDEMGFDYSELGFDFEINEEEEEVYPDGVKGSMAETFGVAPFSILDTRKGEWLEKKRWWKEQIQDNGESREGTLSGGDNLINELNDGVSLLDPVLSELMTGWFGKKDGFVLDPFAGDSVFGFVSSSLGMNFTGIELRKEQADLNQKRCTDAGLNNAVYICDTSENMDKHIEDKSQDMIFSCPPYADLEVYSDNPKDLSTMGHDQFFQVYKSILQNTFAKLKDNRFAVVVMGEVRGKKGGYIGTIPKTIDIMEQAGYTYYNEIILINSAGTLPLRAGKFMRTSRKIGKMHQNILVFLKGDAKKAVADLGDIDIDFEYNEED